MSTYVLTVQDVAGDPVLDGGEIVIMKDKTSTVIFSELGDCFLSRDTEARVSVAGVGSDFTFAYLGYGYVKGNIAHQAQFVRIALANGDFKTVAIDVSDEGAPLLPCGGTGLSIKSLAKTGPRPVPLTPASFTGGTLVRTENGDCMVEDLLPGMKIWTLANGYLRLRKILRSKVQGNDRAAPVLFCADSIGNDEPLLLSPNHSLHFDNSETGKEELIAAKNLVNGKTIVRMPIPVVEYYHLVLDDYSLLDTFGALSEYFFPEPVTVKRASQVAAVENRRPWMSAVEIMGATASPSLNYA